MGVRERERGGRERERERERLVISLLEGKQDGSASLALSLTVEHNYPEREIER